MKAGEAESDMILRLILAHYDAATLSLCKSEGSSAACFLSFATGPIMQFAFQIIRFDVTRIHHQRLKDSFKVIKHRFKRHTPLALCRLYGACHWDK